MENADDRKCMQEQPHVRKKKKESGVQVASAWLQHAADPCVPRPDECGREVRGVCVGPARILEAVPFGRAASHSSFADVVGNLSVYANYKTNSRKRHDASTRAPTRADMWRAAAAHEQESLSMFITSHNTTDDPNCSGHLCGNVSFISDSPKRSRREPLAIAGYWKSRASKRKDLSLMLWQTVALPSDD